MGEVGEAVRQEDSEEGDLAVSEIEINVQPEEKPAERWLHLVWDEVGATHEKVPEGAEENLAFVQRFIDTRMGGAYVAKEDGTFARSNSSLPGKWFFDDELLEPSAYSPDSK